MKKLFIFLFVFANNIFSQLFTPNAELIKTDKFKITFGINEYYKKGDYETSGSVNIFPFILQLGLAKKVEFTGIFPYIQLRQLYIPESETFGDIIIYLKFDIKKFIYKYPKFISSIPVYNYLNFITGFNIATGPVKQENREFEKYSTGLPDWRIGLVYGNYFGDLYIDTSFIYVFASYYGEDYLPFSSEIFSTSKNSYFFDIHKVIVKFLWPGKYPWAEKDAPTIDKYPHSDDYFMFSANLNYNLYPNFTLFDYGFFVQFDWLQSFNKLCLKQTELLITPGMQIFISKTATLIGAVSLPIDKNKRAYYFDIKYFLGFSFLL